MQYLINSPANPNLDKLLEYAKTLGIEVSPLPALAKEKKFETESLLLQTKAERLDASVLHNDLSEEDIAHEIQAYRDGK
jgi:hypothetical protein